MTYQDTTHMHPVAGEEAAPSGSGWLIPAVGGGVLTLLWGAYTIMYVAHMIMLPMP